MGWPYPKVAGHDRKGMFGQSESKKGPKTAEDLGSRQENISLAVPLSICKNPAMNGGWGPLGGKNARIGGDK